MQQPANSLIASGTRVEIEHTVVAREEAGRADPIGDIYGFGDEEVPRHAAAPQLVATTVDRQQGNIRRQRRDLLDQSVERRAVAGTPRIT
jgi:hypothetical protein